MPLFDFVEKIVYINLEHRMDRKAELEKELEIIPKEKVLRFNAIADSNGSFGCTKSHIAVLELAIENGWSSVLVLEDDASWCNFEREYPILEKLVQQPYDVICLGALGYSDEVTHRLSSGQTTTAYLVHSHYYKTLLENFKEGLRLYIENQHIPHIGYTYAIDQYWKRLQSTDTWYRVRLMLQRPSFSDICKCNVDYKSMFG